MYAEQSPNPPDKIPPSPPQDKQSHSSSESKSSAKISSRGPRRVSAKPCRYILSNEVCPFGKRCHFSHTIPEHTTETSYTLDPPHENTEKPHEQVSDRSQHTRVQSDKRQRKYHHRLRVKEPRNREQNPLPPRADIVPSEDQQLSSARSENTPLVDGNRVERPIAAAARDGRRGRQGPSELNLGSFITPFNRPPVQRPRAKKTTKPSSSELREVHVCVIDWPVYS